MNVPYTRAPHTKGAPGPQSEAPNAALLIDFDNVTMGMRSDLSKELKNLLNSDIIKGKVTVQRAYADWRRYPQYIVPLSENSVDLIFAPAYGSSKKNATDIRMAIDGMELVFIRPEIGTYILLTGDSDFSSLVLKLKEYGKYVIGVGIQESSSDILVQNCDEYYSYTSIAGLRKTTDSTNKPLDPWVLVQEAAQKMASRNDVMRSDRLKQVMMEVDPSFDEGNFGFSKFSKFLSEAAGRNLVELKKLDNGQYEVRPKGRGKDDGGRDRGGVERKAEERSREEEEKRTAGKDRVREKGEQKERGEGADRSTRGGRKKEPETREGEGPLQAAYSLLKEAMESLTESGGGAEPVRDSDLKRRMLQIRSDFDEGELGFGKFSRFLRQAHDHEIVDLEKRDDGTYQVSVNEEGRPAVPGGAPAVERGIPEGDRESAGATSPGPETREGEDLRGEAPSRDAKPSGGPKEESLPEEEFGKKKTGAPDRKGLGPRLGERRGRRGKGGPPPIFEGQVVSAGSDPAEGEDRATTEGAASSEVPAGVAGPPHSRGRGREKERRGEVQDAAGLLEEVPGTEDGGPAAELDPGRLGLPTDGPAIIRYFTNSYKGVGKKTAESLVEEFGTGVFAVLRDNPERVAELVPGKRSEQLLSAWRADYGRRAEKVAKGAGVRNGEGEEEGGSRAEAQDTERGGSPSTVEVQETAGGGSRKSAGSLRRTRRGSRSRRG